MITIYIGKPDKKINAESLDAAFLGIQKVFEIVYSADLFGEKKTYRIINCDIDESVKTETIKFLAQEYHGFHDTVIIFDKLLAPERKKIHESINIIETKPSKSIDTTFNAFSLGNAFATGDKKKTWMVFQELLSHDDEMEKTHGLVWWKLKDIMQKGGVFNESQLIEMARILVSTYHESRIGGLGLKERLELFFLTLPEIKK